MVTISVAMCNGKKIPIEAIFEDRDDGKQIYKEGIYEELREKSQNGELYCEDCGERLILIASRSMTKAQHFRHRYEDSEKRCSAVTEGIESINSRRVLKSWLSIKLKDEDIEPRVTIRSISDSNRKYEFSLLSKSSNVALCYWYTGENITDEKLRILDENKKELFIIHVIDIKNSGCPDGQYQATVMKIQKQQGFVLYLTIDNENGSDYSKAYLKAAIQRQDIDNNWEEITFAEGRISEFDIKNENIWYKSQTLTEIADETDRNYSSKMEKIRQDREAQREAERKQEEERRKAWELRLKEQQKEKERKEQEYQRNLEKQRQEANKKREEENALRIKYKNHLEEMLNESDVALTDPDGFTWIKCRVCGRIGNPVDFITEYNGEKRKNPGKCKRCPRDEDDGREKLKQERINKANTCEKCGRKLVIRRRKADGREFYACPNYDCHYTKSIF